MGIFSFFKPGRFAPKWTFTTEGALWRILFSEHGMIVGEDRDEEEKLLSYFCLDGLTGRVLWDRQKYGMEWWSGIDAIEGNTLFIHGYASPDMPVHKGIIAVDILSGKVIWENPDLRLLSVHGGTVIGNRDFFERRIFYRLDPLTGAVVEETTDRKKFGDMPGLGIDERRFTFPVSLMPGGDAPGEIIGEYIRPDELIGTVEYIEHDDMLLFNYHEKNMETSSERIILKNYFKIVSIANEGLLFSETLNTNASYPIPDAFFLYDDVLFYVKDRSTLTAIPLSWRTTRE